MLGFDALGRNALGPPELALPTAYELAMGAGAFTLTGQAAGLTVGRVLAMGTGAFTLTGQDVTLTPARSIAMGAGAFTLSGQDVDLLATHFLAMGAGSYTLTGQDATLRIGYTLSLGTGVFVLTGESLDNYPMPADTGVFVLTGSEAYFVRQTLRDAMPDVLVLTLSPSLTLNGSAVDHIASTFDPALFEAGTFDTALNTGFSLTLRLPNPSVGTGFNLALNQSATDPITPLHELGMN